MRWEIQPDFGMLEATTLTQRADSQSRNQQVGSGSASSVGPSYVSPLTAIYKTIRRQNPVAAAAALTSSAMPSKLMMSGDSATDNETVSKEDILNPADPWSLPSSSHPQNGVQPLSVEKIDSEDPSADENIGECKCQFIGRRGSIKPGTSDICAHCGKRRPSSTGGRFRRRRSISATQQLQNHLSYMQKTEMKQDPEHSQALLQTTPQLRFICSASTDMDVFGHLGNLNIIQRSFIPLATILEGGNPGSSASMGKRPVVTANTLGPSPELSEYKASLLRDRTNKQAASELASLLWVLSHEMSQEDFFAVESEVYSKVFSLVHSTDKHRRMAGLAALDALLAAPSADEEKKSIKCANTLSAGLRAAHGDFEYLSAVSQAFGHMATRTANVDVVEGEVARALEWLGTERSDRRLAACLSLKQFAMNAPTTFHTKTSQSAVGQGGTNEFLDQIFSAIRDPQPIVRACAVDALSQSLKIIVDRKHSSMNVLLFNVHAALMEGLNDDCTRKRSRQATIAAEASQHGSLLVVSTMLAYASDFLVPRYVEICQAVLALRGHSKALIRLEVVRLIPRLANTNPKVFGRRYLEESLLFLIEVASTAPSPRVGVDIRPSAYRAIGQLILAMMDDETGEVIGCQEAPTMKIVAVESGGSIFELKPRGIVLDKLEKLFALLKEGLELFRGGSGVHLGVNHDSTQRGINPVLHCAANLVVALGDLAKPFMPDLISDMFRAGLSNDLIRCLQSVARCVPDQQGVIEDRILQSVSTCLAGLTEVYDPLSSPMFSAGHDEAAVINMSTEPAAVHSLVLSLQTLASFGGTLRKAKAAGNSVPLLPFVQNVAAKYLNHPSSEVRRAACLTCCALLLPYRVARESRIGGYTGVIIDEVLETLLTVAVSDPSAVVRISVVQALDSRYDSFLCQRHHLPELFLLLQDEHLATRAAGMRLLGRLAAINPAPILPVMRHVLNGLIVEMQCGIYTGRAREEATRLCVIFCRAKPFQRLVQPVLQSLIDALPIHDLAPPRLVSASLEALGALAQATGTALQPFIKDLIPHILEIMQDQSSASKQRTSLRTLGQIAGSTGYVIKPYLDYPSLLSQATDILPATKRAPWSLRREVIRSLGILGALDPDRYSSASKARKAGAVGGAYFEESDFTETSNSTNLEQNGGGSSAHQDYDPDNKGNDEDLPAYLFMHEQYAMFAQPISELRQSSKRMTPAEPDFYPTVAIQALMRIFRDPNLAVHHSMVVQAVMFIFKSMGLGCVPYLKNVVPHLMATVRTCVSNNLRESMLKQLARLSLIVREHLRPYVSDIFDIVEIFWSSRHLATIFGLISNIAVGVPDSFRRFLPRLIRRLLTTFDDLQIADWTDSENKIAMKRSSDGTDRLQLLLQSLSNLKGVLGDYLHILVPALLKLADSLASLAINHEAAVVEETLSDLSVSVYRTISILLESKGSSGSRRATSYQQTAVTRVSIRQSSESFLPSRVVQPLVRLIREKPTSSLPVGLAMVETLCVCAKLIGYSGWSGTYDGVVRRALETWESSFPIVNTNRSTFALHGVDEDQQKCVHVYDNFIENLRLPAVDTVGPQPSVKSLPALFLGANEYYISGGDSAPESYEQLALSPSNGGTPKRQVNQHNLQRAWDVSQRSSRDDWDEWMRRFSIQLLREAPAAALRSTANLAQAYQPLARELFSAAFACCWEQLTAPYRVNLVHALETAFVADVSPEILQALLNLAEFMEHDPAGGLPIDIPILADLALKCRAYGRALHYKEKEYSLGGDTKCVESLISINRKLDLQEAALGVLKASSMGNSRFSNNAVKAQLTSKFSRHQTRDMCYSVIWSTDERLQTKGESVDLAEKEELWLARLGSWTESLTLYEAKLSRDPNDSEAILGCMRCLGAIGEWKKVLDLADDNWDIMSGAYAARNEHIPDPMNPRARRKALRICAQSAWRLGQWEKLEQFASQLVGGKGWLQNSPVASSPGFFASKVDFDGAFFSAVLHVHRKEWSNAAEAIDAARKAMDSRLTALMAESHSRAYSSMVTAQTLAEMEEIVAFRRLEEYAMSSSNQHPLNRPNAEAARQQLLNVWRDRLAGCRVDAEVHASILAVRSLVVRPDEEVDATLKLSELSRQAQQYKFAERVLLDPLMSLNADLHGPVFGFGIPESMKVSNNLAALSSGQLSTTVERILAGDLRNICETYGSIHEQWSRKLVVDAGGLQRLDIQHRLYFAYVRHLWYTDRKEEAMTRLSLFCDVVEMVARCEGVTDTSLRVACWLELGEWKILQGAPPGTSLRNNLKVEALATLKRTTMLEECGYKAWHAWALLNLRIVMEQRDKENLEKVSNAQSTRMIRNHTVAAVKGFVNAISLGTRKWSASVQQDLLNLLTCLFQFGKVQDVASIINDCIGAVVIEAWLGVLPQLLARIHIVDPSVRAVLHPLLIRLGEKHPQALMYPLSVLINSPVAERKASAESLMNSLKAHSSALVEEAQMVSSELIRVAILWLEMWHEGLEDASRLYFGDRNVAGMLDLLLPLHEMLEKGAETRKEVEYLNMFGQDLSKAYSYIKEYSELATPDKSLDSSPASGSRMKDAETAMQRAWNIYYSVFRQINKQLPSLTELELSQCSPALSSARSLELGVPGTYRVDGSYIKIERVHSEVEVITSKQRPRKIRMRGSDGRNYLFLLKGHEDLRQDERVMQLFGLVNALLVRDLQTKKFDLWIQRYAISALSHNCGVVGWVPHSDTLHSLIRDYRTGKKVPLNMENREMQRIAPDYDLLTVMQKVEVFTEALKRTTGGGKDLGEILWLKSTNSEEWLDRRTKFTRSLAVMSIVGYILGLGDRHPSNLMLDKVSGRILHIDFGDCFEVAMNREKFPEKVPFRLTRMLIRAMEVSGIEGSYRSTCERTMSVLRGSRDSLVTMLEAFVYDPLISWRLGDLSNGSSTGSHVGSRAGLSSAVGGMTASVDGAGTRVDPIKEVADEDMDEDDHGDIGGPGDLVDEMQARSRALSMKMYANIQHMAANLTTDSRIASITGERSEQVAVEGSLARSRIDKSMKQRELLNLLRSADGTAFEEALNEKALRVIRRVQDKLTGTDFPESKQEPLDVTDQVQRLIVQATSSENLCQLFIGWCAFW